MGVWWWPEPFEQTFIPASSGVSIWNLSLIGPVVSEEKIFENVDKQMTEGWWNTDAEVTSILIPHPWAFSSDNLNNTQFVVRNWHIGKVSR